MIKFLLFLLCSSLSAKEFVTSTSLYYTFLIDTVENLSVYKDLSPEGNIGNIGNIYFPEFYASSGVSVGVGQKSFDECWIYGQYYWHKRNREYSATKAPTSMESNNPYLFASWPVDQKNLNFVDGLVRSVWNNFFQKAYVVLSREWAIGHIFLDPFFGILGAWDDWAFNLSYGYVADSTPSVVEWTNSQKWWSIGPYVGFEPKLRIPIYENYSLSLSARLGFVNPWSKTELSLNNGSKGYTFSNWQVTPAVESNILVESVGEYEWGIVRFVVGWDLEIWFERNQISIFSNVATAPTVGVLQSGSLSLQGLRCGLVLLL